MSTFIYQNGVLHADTRKIVNFPGRQMMTTDFESKVHKDKWCYIAVSGFEPTGQMLMQVKRFLTTIQSCKHVAEVVEEAMKNAKLKRGKVGFINDLTEFGERVSEAAKEVVGNLAFLAVTKDYVFGSEGDLAEFSYRKGVQAQKSDSIEVIGSAQHAARILLLNGISPKEIYPILRAGNAPTGETCETFDIKKLSPLQTPWLDKEVWFYACSMIGTQVKGLTDEEKDKAIDLFTMIPKMGKFRWNRNYPNPATIEKIINEWHDKKHRETEDYKMYRKGFFK